MKLESQWKHDKLVHNVEILLKYVCPLLRRYFETKILLHKNKHISNVETQIWGQYKLWTFKKTINFVSFS